MTQHGEQRGGHSLSQLALALHVLTEGIALRSGSAEPSPLRSPAGGGYFLPAPGDVLMPFGPFPTGTVATTFRAATSMTETVSSKVLVT